MLSVQLSHLPEFVFRPVGWRWSTSWVLHSNLLIQWSFWRTLHPWREEWKGQVLLLWWKVPTRLAHERFTIIVAYTFILFWWSLGSDTVYVYVVEHRWSGEAQGYLGDTKWIYREWKHISPEHVNLQTWKSNHFFSFWQWTSSLSNTFELSSLFHLTVSGFFMWSQMMTFVGVTNNIKWD